MSKQVQGTNSEANVLERGKVELAYMESVHSSVVGQRKNGLLFKGLWPEGTQHSTRSLVLYIMKIYILFSKLNLEKHLCSTHYNSFVFSYFVED